MDKKQFTKKRGVQGGTAYPSAYSFPHLFFNFQQYGVEKENFNIMSEKRGENF